MNYKYEDLSKIILSQIYVTKDTRNFMAVIYDGNINCYSLNPENEDCPDMVKEIQSAFLLFFNEFIQNDNFDAYNLRKNMDKNFVVGVAMDDINPDASTIIFDESRNLFGIFGDKNLVQNGNIFHELFHFAFRPQNGTNFNRGLNEGYVEALTHRYFNKNKQAYPDNVYYALELEKIIGKNVMEKAISLGDINIITNDFDEEMVGAFNKYNEKMDLLLGSYYRVNSGKALLDEKARVESAKKVLDENLEIIASNFQKEKKSAK